MAHTRRQMLHAMTGSMAVSMGVTQSGCTSTATYDAAVANTWRHSSVANASEADRLQELVRYATLAANGHNTQPWQFELARDAITLRPDLTRRTPAVDPDDHHLWISLGCAAENLMIAARAFGLDSESSTEGSAVRIALRPGTAQSSPLFDAIVKRQNTRSPYDGKPLAAEELKTLQNTSAIPTVKLIWLNERQRLQTLAEFVTRGVQAQMADPAFVAELKQWIRFNPNDAAASGDGLFAGSSGNPSLPHWLGSRLFGLFFTAQAEVKRYQEQVRTSAGAVVFVGAKEDPPHWVDVGRAYQRFALQATALDIRNSMLNQPVEVAPVRREFAAWLGVGAARPDLVVRFGRAAPLPPSLRRPLADVVRTV